jgi:hypothetical protein
MIVTIVSQIPAEGAVANTRFSPFLRLFTRIGP